MLKTTLASAAVTALTVGTLALGAGGAQATTVHPATNSPRITGGCTLTKPHICGTVENDTNTHIAVCRDWHANGTDQTYQSANHCRAVAYVKPHTTYGSPQTIDLDAFYIAKGTSYSGSYVCGLHKRVYRTWSHRKSGWWKFGTLCEVRINSKRG